MASLPLISRVENLLPLHKTLPSGYLEREASQSQSPQILNPTMCKCKIEKDPQEQPEFESLPERQVDSPPRRRSLRRISDENQNGNANASATDESSGGGVSTRSRKRLRSESTQVISLDSPVKWKSHGKSTNRSRAGNEDVKSSRESGEIRCALLCNSEEKKSKSGLMPKAQTDSPGKRRSPRTKGMENEDQNGSVSEISSLTGSKDVSTPEHKETRSELIQNDSPRKWKSPRRCRNGIRNEDNVCENNVIGSGRDSTPERKKLRSESMPESKLDSPLRWRSPRRCTHGDSNGDKHKNSPQKSSEAGSEGSTPQKQIFASQKTPTGPASSPKKWTSPRRCANVAQNGSANGILVRSPKSPRRRLLDQFPQKPRWNPRDSSQINAVKEALHVSVAPSTVVCREEEQKKVLEFCKACIEYEKAGSLYICGCPGTGKTLSMEKVKAQLLGWIKEMEFAEPDVLALTCTSLGTSSEIFSKILERCHVRKKKNGICSPLQQLQNLFSQKKQGKMMLVVVDEMDYLITRDRAVLHDLFMLTTFPLSRFILVGIANAIDLADRFLPKLKSLNCKPMVITFRAYCKEQILRILHQRLMALSYDSFHPQALELCARKVAAASGDMRKALSVCRSAIEVLEAELREVNANLDSQGEKTPSAQLVTVPIEFLTKQEMDIVRVDHMALALSKTFKSVIVDTIQLLPQHQQITLCSTVKLFRKAKADTTMGELYKSYSDICKTARVSPASMLEFSNMCRVLADQGLIRLGQSREEKLKRIALKVDEGDITFALQGIRFFRNCLQ